METIQNQIQLTLSYIFQITDFVYLICFMLISYMIISLKINVKYPKLKVKYQVLLIGIVVAIIFSFVKYVYGLPWHTTSLPYGFVITFTFLLGQFLNKYGLENIITKLKSIIQKLETKLFDTLINL
jgi:hypothetical protein